MRQLFLFALIAVFSFSSFTVKDGLITNEDCIKQLNSLISATGDATSLIVKDKTGLQEKATNAKEAYSSGKMDDALDNLYDYESKVEELADGPKPKISSTDYESLTKAVKAAIACL